MIDLAYLSLSSDALNVDLFSLYSGILHVAHCSPFAIVSRFVRPRSTRSNWSREKLGFISVPFAHDLRFVARRNLRFADRRGLRTTKGCTHCGGSCHWGFGNMSVYASRIAFGNVSSNLFRRHRRRRRGFCLPSHIPNLRESRSYSVLKRNTQYEKYPNWLPLSCSKIKLRNEKSV